jgi:hypothetical protein
MRSAFKVIPNGLCAQCPPGTGPQIVARYGNGLHLCENHDRAVRSNHREVYENHPLLRDKDDLDGE